MDNTYRDTLNEATLDELTELISMEYPDLDLIDPEDEDTIRAELIEHLEDRGDWIDTAEEDALDSVYNGNWTEGAQIMKDNYISITNLIDYIEAKEDEGADYDWFDRGSAVALNSELDRLFRES